MANAARRAEEAGADAVELHCAHGYLLHSFLSPRTNHRTDAFGGCLENRLRIVRQIVENIRSKTGKWAGAFMPDQRAGRQ